jgi:SWI/SNF-related matrix-associated actin-dependent regulator 1 of chromatin subfamily A
MFSLQLLERVIGLEVDGVTLHKKPYLGLFCSTEWTRVQYAALATALAALNVHTTELLVNQSNSNGGTTPTHVYVDVRDANVARQAMKSCFPETHEDASLSVNKRLCEIVRVLQDNCLPLTLDQVRQTVNRDALWSQLRPFQRTAVRFAVCRESVYIADEMGLGKTVEALAICQFYKATRWPVLIICPSILVHTWKAEILKWLGLDEAAVLVVSSTKGVTSLDLTVHSFVIVSYALTLRQPVFTQLRSGFAVVILDEAHYVKSARSQRAKACLKLASQAKSRFLLSGTPFPYPRDLYNQLRFLAPDLYPKFFHFRPHGVASAKQSNYFAERYCNPTKTMFRGRPQWAFTGATHTQELSAILCLLMCRRKKLHVLPQLPDKHRSCVILKPLSVRNIKMLQTLLHKSTAAGITATTTDTDDTNATRNTFMECFRQTCALKIPGVEQYIRSFVLPSLVNDQQGGILLFVHHYQMKTAMEQLLTSKGISYCTLDGSTSKVQRALFEQQFQAGAYAVAILSIKAAGTGLTLTHANLVIFTEILFNPSDMLQAEDRAHRIGQTNEVHIVYLMQPHSTDDINWGLIKKKERITSSIIDHTVHRLVYTTTKVACATTRKRAASASTTLAQKVKRTIIK